MTASVAGASDVEAADAGAAVCSPHSRSTPGEMFGEVALFIGGKRTATVVAIQDSEAPEDRGLRGGAAAPK
jgi:CRP-like cAMP-binding protein